MWIWYVIYYNQNILFCPFCLTNWFLLFFLLLSSYSRYWILAIKSIPKLAICFDFNLELCYKRHLTLENSWFQKKAIFSLYKFDSLPDALSRSYITGQVNMYCMKNTKTAHAQCMHSAHHFVEIFLIAPRKLTNRKWFSVKNESPTVNIDCWVTFHSHPKVMYQSITYNFYWVLHHLTLVRMKT